MKAVAAFLAAGVFWAALAAAQQQEGLAHGQFSMRMQADNVFLPDSIRWTRGDVELIRPQTGLDHGFTSFEFRNKIYRNENRHTWGGREEPRFLTDAMFRQKREAKRDGWAGVEVEYDSSYAKVRRTILFHDAEPRLRIEYAFEMTRDVVIHETHMFAVRIAFAEGFTARAVPDARAEDAAILLAAEGLKGNSVSISPLHPGPIVVTDPEKKVSVLVIGSHSGDVPQDAPVQRLKVAKGHTLTLAAELTCGAAGDEALLAEMRTAHEAMPVASRAYLLLENAAILRHQGRLDEAEAALLESARLSPEFAEPYAELAALRRDHKRPGELEAWAEGGWRMPYNYGYILSASGIVNDQRLTEAERRLAMFNMLIAVENTVFYPDYYIWAARGFEARGMVAQACAMYRQALWAVDHMPRPDAFKERLREQFRKKIADFEAQMLHQTLTDLPEVIPTRPVER